jgi:hypothetical protein
VCYNSLAEVIAVNPCSTWDNMPLPNTACEFHGCILDSTQRVCLTPGAGGGNATAVNLNLEALFVNPKVAANSLNLTVQVWLRNQLRVWPTVWTYLSIGGGVPGYGAPDKLTPSVCNNIKAYNNSVTPPFFVAATDPNGLQSYFNDWVQTHHDYDFDTANTTFGAPLTKIMGDISIGPGKFDTSVSLDTSSNWVIHDVSVNLNNIVSSCTRFGASEVYTATDRYYTVPIAVIQRDYMNNFAQLSASFYVRMSLAGSIISVTSSSRYQPVLFRSELTSITSLCPAGQALIQTVYVLQIQNVYPSGIFVGPRNISDIKFTSPALGNTLQNCYGEYPYELSRIGCYNNVCYTQITTRTKCRTLTPDGQAFNNCSYAEVADKELDVGVGGSYDTSLNGVHSFWVDDWSCPFSANYTNNWANCTLANQSPFGYPDPLISTVSVSLFPQTVLSVSFDVYAGLLPSPTTMDLTQIMTLSQGPNQVTSAQDLFNTQLQWNGLFTYVAGVLDPAIRQVANLTLTVNTLFKIEPLDLDGNILPTGQVLYISDVFPYMTYVPKQMLEFCEDTGCKNTPATANQTAYDSFSIPVVTLRTLMPANGYAVSTSYLVDIPHSLHATPLSSKMHVMDAMTGKRQLLSINEDGTMTGSSRFRFLIDDSRNPNPPAVIALNSTNVPVGSTIVKGYQVAMRLYVDSSSELADPNNHTALEEFAAGALPKAVAETLRIDRRQIMNVKAQTKADFGLATMRKLKAVVGVPLYISFVLIPYSNVSTTAAMLASTLTSPSVMDMLKMNLLMEHLVLDVTVPPTYVAVYLYAPINLDNVQSNIVHPHDERSMTDNLGLVAMVVIASLVIVFAIACVAHMLRKPSSKGFNIIPSAAD